VPIIRQVADGLEPLAHERQVEIDIDLPELPVTIAGDREELLRLFENLIENALKYGASGGKVIVSLVRASSAEGRRKSASWSAISAPDCAGTPAAAHRTLLPGRCRRQPGAGWNRARFILG
jgi:Signal transduction histidine kinase